MHSNLFHHHLIIMLLPVSTFWRTYSTFGTGTTIPCVLSFFLKRRSRVRLNWYLAYQSRFSRTRIPPSTTEYGLAVDLLDLIWCFGPFSVLKVRSRSCGGLCDILWFATLNRLPWQGWRTKFLLSWCLSCLPQDITGCADRMVLSEYLVASTMSIVNFAVCIVVWVYLLSSLLQC